MENYTTKAEAEKRWKSSISTQCSKFCPLLKKTCGNACASFDAGGVVRIGEYNFKYKKARRRAEEGVPDENLDIWHSNDACCTNAIVTGVVWCSHDQ